MEVFKNFLLTLTFALSISKLNQLMLLPEEIHERKKIRTIDPKNVERMLLTDKQTNNIKH